MRLPLNWAHQGLCRVRGDRRIGECDDRNDYGEDRFTRIGMVEGTLLFVSYTERDDRIRIISARRATKHEQNDYYRQNESTP
jgi:uncharacterized protein